MPMTPDEYAQRELNVPGYTSGELIYAPGENPSEFDPNILLVMNGGVPHKPEPDARTVEMAFEYNFTLPIELRRAEVSSEHAKHAHLNAKANFWNSLAALIAPRVK